MITRGEYEFATFPSECLCEWQIMPLRNEYNKKQVRGEDVCYLQEMTQRHEFCSSTNPVYIYSHALTPMTKEIKHIRYEEIINHLTDMCARDNNQNGKAIKADFQWNRKTKYDNWGLDTTPLVLYPEAHFDKTQLVSDITDFQRYREEGVLKYPPLKKDAVNNVFDDVYATRFFQGYYPQSSTYANWMNATYELDDQDEEGIINSNRFLGKLPSLYRYSSSRYYDENRQERWAMKAASANFCEILFKIDQRRLNLMAETCYIALPYYFEKSWYVDLWSADSSTRYGVTFVKGTKSVQRGCYVITNQEMSSVFNGLKRTFGIPVVCSGWSPESYSSTGTTGVFSAQLDLLIPKHGVFSLKEDTYWETY